MREFKQLKHICSSNTFSILYYKLYNTAKKGSKNIRTTSLRESDKEKRENRGLSSGNDGHILLLTAPERYNFYSVISRYLGQDIVRIVTNTIWVSKQNLFFKSQEGIIRYRIEIYYGLLEVGGVKRHLKKKLYFTSFITTNKAPR